MFVSRQHHSTTFISTPVNDPHAQGWPYLNSAINEIWLDARSPVGIFNVFKRTFDKETFST